MLENLRTVPLKHISLYNYSEGRTREGRDIVKQLINLLIL
jgi:hypothetical protein